MFSNNSFSFYCLISSYLAYNYYFYAWIYCSNMLWFSVSDLSLSLFYCPIISSYYTFSSRSYKSITFLFVDYLFYLNIFSNDHTLRWDIYNSFFNSYTYVRCLSDYNSDDFSFYIILFFELDYNRSD